MDADIVREIEFSRSLRGYNTAEVDAFLERMEGMFRRRDLEQENLEKKLQEQSQRGTEQENRISFLAAKVEEGQQEAETLRAELANVQAALEAGCGCVLDCRLDMDEMVRPMVAGGAHITDFLLN